MDRDGQGLIGMDRDGQGNIQIMMNASKVRLKSMIESEKYGYSTTISRD